MPKKIYGKGKFHLRNFTEYLAYQFGSIAAVAEAIGVNRETYWRWCHKGQGVDPKYYGKLIQAAAAAGIKIDFDWTPDFCPVCNGRIQKRG